MKFLALIDVVPGAPIRELREGLLAELQESWKLYAADTLREAYATDLPTRVAFVLECPDSPGARAHLESFPLVRSGLLKFDLIELRPFVNWALLFARE